MDAQGVIGAWNAQASATFVWTRAEAMGRLASELIVPPDFRERHRIGLSNFRLGADSKVIGQRVRLPSVQRDGSALVVELQVAATVSCA